jgi:hypothetical protein
VREAGNPPLRSGGGGRRRSRLTEGGLSTTPDAPSCRNHCSKDKSIRHLRARMYSVAHVTPASTPRLPASSCHVLAPHLGPGAAASRSGADGLWERRTIPLERHAERPRLPHIHRLDARTEESAHFPETRKRPPRRRVRWAAVYASVSPLAAPLPRACEEKQTHCVCPSKGWGEG